MKTTTNDHKMVKRLATAAAVWAVAKLLDVPRIAKATRKADDSIQKKTDRMGKAMRRAGSRARDNNGLLIAGVAALALAAGLLGRASTR